MEEQRPREGEEEGGSRMLQVNLSGGIAAGCFDGPHLLNGPAAHGDALALVLQTSQNELTPEIRRQSLFILVIGSYPYS